jgi:hypothetical protein
MIDEKLIVLIHFVIHHNIANRFVCNGSYKALVVFVVEFGLVRLSFVTVNIGFISQRRIDSQGDFPFRQVSILTLRHDRPSVQFCHSYVVI